MSFPLNATNGKNGDNVTKEIARIGPNIGNVLTMKFTMPLCKMIVPEIAGAFQNVQQERTDMYIKIPQVGITNTEERIYYDVIIEY
mmetsp:Transcript_25114/g.28942  ORF Transcript_25114/g.28942 Transcript_25114/m.28942 type:complete len:86 (-) Transcript_25114:24-281(-)